MPGESQGVDLIVDEFEHIVQLTPVIISSPRNRQNRFGINGGGVRDNRGKFY